MKSLSLAKTLIALSVAAGLAALLVQPLEAEARRCPRYWNPVRTRGMNYHFQVHGQLGLGFGEGSKNVLQTGLLMGGAQVDLRGRFGPFVLGGVGNFVFGKEKHQLLDLHLGVDFREHGRTRYRYRIASRHMGTFRTWRGRYRWIRNYYCNETQWYAKHKQITVGPKLAFTPLGTGFGGHATFRFLRVHTRSEYVFYIDVQANYAALNLFSKEKGEDLYHAYGGELKFGSSYGVFSSAFSIGYFAETFYMHLLAGVSFWGA